MKSKAVLTGLLLLLAFTSFSFKCDGGPPPDNSPLRPAAKAAGDIAAAINAMIKVKRSLAQKGTLKPEEEIVLTAALLKLNNADKAFVKEVNAVKSSGDATTAQPKLCAAFTLLTTALGEVNNQGVLPVSDLNTKAQLATAFATISNFLPAITSVLHCS